MIKITISHPLMNKSYNIIMDQSVKNDQDLLDEIKYEIVYNDILVKFNDHEDFVDFVDLVKMTVVDIGQSYIISK